MQPTQLTATAPRVLARDLATVQPGERATLAGWIHRRRVLASVTFLVLRDRSGLAQVVVKDRETVEQLAGLPEETVVEVTGTVSANESAPGRRRARRTRRSRRSPSRRSPRRPSCGDRRSGPGCRRTSTMRR